MNNTQGGARVLVVDDSPAMQQLMKILIESEAGYALTGIAGSAEQGWGMFCKTPPDVVTLDLELPGRPGMDLLKRIMKERPTPVIIVSANGGEGSAETITALGAGAVAFIDKPDNVTVTLERFREKLGRALRKATESSKGVVRATAHIGAAVSPVTPMGAVQRDRIIAIGASTGGVPAVQTVLTGLAKAQIPIVVTQHMPPGYTRRFAERLAQVTGLRVSEARDGDRLEPGCVFIAPGDRHLHVARGPGGSVCRLIDGPLVSGHKPSVDVMFASVAESYGNRAVGVLLTGMGKDGAAGLLAMRQAGAETMVEAEYSAVVFGMPRAALEAGAAAHSYGVTAIAGEVMKIVAPKGGSEQAAASAPAANQGPMPISEMKVLVVDDQKSMRGLARLSLAQLGFERIEEAESGEDALVHVAKNGCDLMLLDWNMDGMNGLDVLKTIRATPDSKKIVVLMATSEKNITKVHEAINAGANNYLVKPYDTMDLKKRLERALQRAL